MTTAPEGHLADVTALAEPGFVVVRLEGEMDVVNVAHVADRVRQVASDATTVVVDLTGVRYAGSAALRMLEAEGSALVQRGVRFLLVVPAVGSTRRLFGIVGLDQVFPVLASLDEARRVLAG